MKKKKIIIFFIIQAAFLVACIDKSPPLVPKPKGYFRLSVPQYEYQNWDSLLPFSCEYSKYAQFLFKSKEKNSYWIDIFYPSLNASLKMTYIPLKNNLRELIVSEEKMVMFHVDRRKADDVQSSIIYDKQATLYGQIYEIEGKDVACTMQLWLTDSIHHYVRASLYFNFAPNNDSLAPIIQYLKKDIMHLVDTWKWK